MKAVPAARARARRGGWQLATNISRAGETQQVSGASDWCQRFGRDESVSRRRPSRVHGLDVPVAVVSEEFGSDGSVLRRRHCRDFGTGQTKARDFLGKHVHGIKTSPAERRRTGLEIKTHAVLRVFFWGLLLLCLLSVVRVLWV